MIEDIKIRLTSRVIGLVKRIPAELVERKRSRTPYLFVWVGMDKQGNFNYDGRTVPAEPVGKERRVQHPSLYDMQPTAVRWAMTKAKFLEEGFDANAVYVDPDKFTRPDPSVPVGVTTYQPLKIPSDALEELC